MNKNDFFKALREKASEEFKDIPEENEISYEFSDSFNKKMKDLTECPDAGKVRRFTYSRRLVAALVAAVILLFAGILGVSASRNYISRFFSRYNQETYHFVSHGIKSGDYEYALVEFKGIIGFGKKQYAVITDYLGNDKTLEIPEEIDGHPLYSIGADAFAGSETLISVVFPEGLQEIGENAFRSCKNLKYIELPSSLVTINYGAFADCDVTGSVKLGENFTSVLNGACDEDGEILSAPFDNNPHLTGFDVDNNNAEFSADDGVVFSKDGTRLVHYPQYRPGTSYNVPDTVDVIEAYSFSGAANLEQVVMPVSVRTIGRNAFENSRYLRSITLSNNLKLIEESAFRGCLSLETLSLPKSVSRINGHIFEGCYTLNTVVVFNPNCDIDGEMLYDTVSGSNKYHNDAVMLYGYEGSTAQKFSEKAKINYIRPEFVSLGDGGYISYMAVTDRTHNSVSFTWNEVEGTDIYQTYYSKDGLDWVKSVTTKETSATIDGLEGGEEYYFRVRARYPDGQHSSFRITYTCTLPPSAEDFRVASVSGNKVTLKWKPAESSADIEYTIKGSDGKEVLSDTITGDEAEKINRSGKLTLEIQPDTLKSGEIYTAEIRLFREIQKEHKYCTLESTHTVYGEAQTAEFTAE